MELPPPTTPSSLVFKIHRREPELLRPAKPTPHEFKHLSDIDDQEGLRCFSLNAREGPVKVMREAIATALVFYYPMAGRLREGPNRKLAVECNGEGVLFTEADAEVTLQQLGVAPHLPYPYIDEFLFNVPGSSEILNYPLLIFQVTRLKCGGFTFAFNYNHAMCDALGLVQFCSAVSEIARGADAPSVLPVWERHLLSSIDPPKVTHQHLEYVDTAPGVVDHSSEEQLVDRSFLFGPKELSTLRNLLPPGEKFTSFEILTAYLWKCRTIALQLPPSQEVRVMCTINARQKLVNPPLPRGYYGNAIVCPVALATASNLTRNPLGYALELVKKAKAQFSRDYISSVASLMVTKGRPGYVTARTFELTDITHVGFPELDYGWGEAAYGGPADAGCPEDLACGYLLPFANKKGEKRIIATFSLPAIAMERLSKELRTLFNFNKPTAGHLGSQMSIKYSL
ncbi:hypothetical protein Tsubulata_933360 [Turnera subulata]|uniref:Benzyl alcohol O-benzoyltransferase n=1 Tax=Turnera subulata TaxID=218843 RepID=A0A9Q0G1E8_9ROSI|nr:hypothetical protein Tsubulata_933360 [Turnera subulata]